MPPVKTHIAVITQIRPTDKRGHGKNNSLNTSGKSCKTPPEIKWLVCLEITYSINQATSRNTTNGNTNRCNIYIVIAFNRASLVTSLGDIANMKTGANGGIGFSNSTASLFLGSTRVMASSGGGDGWHPPMAIDDVGNAASYASGAIGLTQIGMLEYRMTLSLSSKIGTFGRFSSTYGTLGKIGGRLGYAGAGISLISDIGELRSGKIGAGRFTYRLGSLGTSIGVVSAIGGPGGAVGGAAVGGISIEAEYIYDNYLVPFGNEIQYQIWNFENAIKGGWYPGR
ncbi:MAG: hypothetical protein K9I94_00970 [Bacteroidales bacterium]|nr:hypothetical protein [Bacteroidales bacterium]